MTNKIEITPETKLGELLETYPCLEETLIKIAPPFKKLKNPMLRRSLARIATIKHVSSVGNVPLNKLINMLREAVGQKQTNESFKDEDYFTDKPGWFSQDKITATVIEEKLKDKDRMTLVTILKEAAGIKKGEILELITTFLPAPGIDVLKSKGYSVWSVKKDYGLIKTYFLKNTEL